MSSITIDFSSGMSKWIKTASLSLLILVVVFSISSVLLLFSGSKAISNYVELHNSNQQLLKERKMSFASLNEQAQNYMLSIPELTGGTMQSGCASPIPHLVAIESLLPKAAIIGRFDFSLASSVITVSVITNSPKVLARFLEGIEANGRYTEVRVKQKTVNQARQYEVQYRCQS